MQFSKKTEGNVRRAGTTTVSLVQSSSDAADACAEGIRAQDHVQLEAGRFLFITHLKHGTNTESIKMMTTKTSSSLSEQDPLRDAVLKEFTEAGYINKEIQTVLAQQDALRRRKDDDADRYGDKKEEPERASWTKVPCKYVLPSMLDTYHLPWQFDKADKESILIKKGVSTELLDEIFKHTRRAREDSYNIRSSNPSKGSVKGCM
ncbi:hypothetical protein BDW60DRAFT_208735 [Aspergillus nidulans var. acristatus]